MGIFDFFSKSKKETLDPVQKETLDQGLEKTKQTFFSKITRLLVGKSRVDQDVLDELEEILITADVGVETTLKIIDRIEARVSRDRVINSEELNQILRDEIIALLEENAANFEGKLKVEKPADGNPYVLMVVGVNGVGKTTTIGKLAYQMKQAGLKVVLGASDTFRAAAVDQLIIWSERVGVPFKDQACNG
jgi:fused signal recognition particle receptor